MYMRIIYFAFSVALARKMIWVHLVVVAQHDISQHDVKMQILSRSEHKDTDESEHKDTEEKSRHTKAAKLLSPPHSSAQQDWRMPAENASDSSDLIFLSFHRD